MTIDGTSLYITDRSDGTVLVIDIGQ